MDNVIEVDFERLDDIPLPELVERIRDSGEKASSSAARVSELVREIRRDIEWQEGQLACERKRRRRAERELLELRRLSFPFTDEDVDAALRRVYAGEPVLGGEVAAALVADPTPSIRVRCGHALSRLAAAGRAQKVKVEEHGEPRNRWRPCDG